MEKQLRLDNKKLYTVNFQIWEDMEEKREEDKFEMVTQYRYTALAATGTEIIAEAEKAINRVRDGVLPPPRIVWLDIREG